MVGTFLFRPDLFLCMSYENVSFRPVSVKKVFTEMKDTAELMIDLSYSAVFSEDGVLANEEM